MQRINNLAITSARSYTARYRYYEIPIDEIPLTQLFVTALLSIILSRTMQAAFGTSRVIPRLRRRRNTRASIAQCIVVASCCDEINVIPVL